MRAVVSPYPPPFPFLLQLTLHNATRVKHSQCKSGNFTKRNYSMVLQAEGLSPKPFPWPPMVSLSLWPQPATQPFFCFFTQSTLHLLPQGLCTYWSLNLPHSRTPTGMRHTDILTHLHTLPLVDLPLTSLHISVKTLLPQGQSSRLYPNTSGGPPYDAPHSLPSL